MRRWSRRSMCPQRFRATAMTQPSQSGAGTVLAEPPLRSGEDRLETLIGLPKPRLPFEAFARGNPAPAKPRLVHPMAHYERWHEQGQRQERCGPRLFPQQFFEDRKHIRRQAEIAAAPSVNLSTSRAQSAEKFIDRTNPWHFRVGASNSSQGVRIAAAYGNLAQLLREPGGPGVGCVPHLAVPRLKTGHIAGKPREVFVLAPARQGRKHVIDAEEELPLRKVHHQSDEVVPSPLDFHMVTLGDSINAQMHFRAARHSHGDLFAEEKIGMAAQHLRAIDRIVVRKGDDGHSRHLEAFIHVLWLVVGLPADSRQAGSVTHAGCDRVHMKVAAHAVIFGMRYEQPMKRSKILRQCAHGTY